MNRFLWLFAILFGIYLPACRPAEPIVLTGTPTAETAVTPAFPATRTPGSTSSTTSPTWPPTTAITTPTSTTLPVILPVQEETATPTWTPTLTPPPSATAFTNQPTLIPRLAAGQILPINHDLLFINDGELRLWQPQTGQVSTLLDGKDAGLVVSGWRATPDRQSVLIAQTPANDSAGFRLSLFDSHRRQVRELWSETDRYLFAYALAGDGRSAAVITSTASLQAGEGLEVVSVIDSEGGQITWLADCPNRRPTGNDANSFVYRARCQSLVSMPGDQTWLWRDIEGVWQGGLDQPPRLLLTHDYFEDDPPRIYSPTNDWSPDGRYQLLSARRFEGKNRWVLDLTTGQTIEVPHSVTGIDQVAYWQWTEDNHLFTVRPPVYNLGEEDNFAELWHVEGEQLQQDASLVLPNPDGVPAAAPSQLADGRYAFVLNHTDPTTASGNLYLITRFDQPAQPLISLPPLEGHWSDIHAQSLTWTPDGSGVLYIWPAPEARQPFYIPADGSALLDLSDRLGRNLTDLIWLP